MMKKLLFILAFCFSAFATAQCPVGNLTQNAKWRFVFTQCMEDTLVIKYTDTSKIAFIDGNGNLTTITYRALLDSLNYYDESEDNKFFLERQMEAAYIRSIAGIASTADTGLASGQTAGINDSASMAIDSNISITSRAEAIALAASGSGTLASPYIIEDKFITLTSNDTCIILNDPDADYYVTFNNIKAVGATSGSKGAYINFPNRVIFQYCNFESNNTQASEGIHVASTAEVQINNCLFPGYGFGANYLELLVNGNIQYTNCLFNHSRYDNSGTSEMINLGPGVTLAYVKFTNCNISSAKFTRLLVETTGSTGTFDFQNTIIDVTSATNLINIQFANTASTVRMVNCYIEYFGSSNGIIQTIALNNYFKNVEIYANMSGNVQFMFADNSDNFFFDRIKSRSYGGVATEIILLTKAFNTTYSNVHIVASTGDGVEIINPLYNNYIYNIVCDSGTTELVDLFRTSVDSINPQYNNIVHNIYGTPRVRPVKLTNVNGWSISNVFTQSVTLAPIVVLSQTGASVGSYPRNNHFLGGTLPRKFIGNALIYTIDGTPHPTLNSAVWSDGDTIFAYNPTQDLENALIELDTLSTEAYDLGPSTSETGTAYIYASNFSSTKTDNIINVEDYLIDRIAARLDSLNRSFTTYTATKYVAKADTNTIQAPTFTGSATQTAFNLTQTWNGTGVFTGISINLTNTASGSSSRPFNISVGGTSEFSINTSGNLFWKNTAQPTFSYGNSVFLLAKVGGGNGTLLYGGGTPALFVASTGVRVQGGSANAPVASAVLQAQSTTQGFLPPVMTAAQASAIASPAQGLMVFTTDTNGTFTSIGWWGYNGTNWTALH